MDVRQCCASVIRETHATISVRRLHVFQTFLVFIKDPTSLPFRLTYTTKPGGHRAITYRKHSPRKRRILVVGIAWPGQTIAGDEAQCALLAKAGVIVVDLRAERERDFRRADTVSTNTDDLYWVCDRSVDGVGDVHVNGDHHFLGGILQYPPIREDGRGDQKSDD